MADGKRHVIEAVCKNGLWMEGVDQINTFIILSGTIRRPFINVGAVEDHEPGGGKKGSALKHNG